MQDRIECHYWLWSACVFNISGRLQIFQSLPIKLFSWITSGIAPNLKTLRRAFHSFLCKHTFLICGPGSVVGIATELRARLSGDGIPVGRDFPPVQTGPGAHPAYCTMGTGLSRGLSGQGVLLTTHLLLMPRSWKSRAIFLPNFWVTTGPVMGLLYLYLYFIILTILVDFI